MSEIDIVLRAAIKRECGEQLTDEEIAAEAADLERTRVMNLLYAIPEAVPITALRTTHEVLRVLHEDGYIVLYDLVLLDGTRVTYVRSHDALVDDEDLAFDEVNGEWRADVEAAEIAAEIAKHLPIADPVTLAPVLASILRRAGASESIRRRIITDAYKRAGAEPLKGIKLICRAEAEYVFSDLSDALTFERADDIYEAIRSAKYHAWLAAQLADVEKFKTCWVFYTSGMGYHVFYRYLREQLAASRDAKKDETSGAPLARRIILDSALAGEDLALWTRAADGSRKLVSDGEGRPYDAHRSIQSLMAMLCSALPSLIAQACAFKPELWGVVEDVIRPSLDASAKASGEDIDRLRRAAIAAYGLATRKRYEREEAEATERAAKKALEEEINARAARARMRGANRK